jgi:hypothetical protein
MTKCGNHRHSLEIQKILEVTEIRLADWILLYGIELLFVCLKES